MTVPSVESRRTSALLGEAAAWLLNGLLLERPRRGWHEEVAAMSAEVEDVGLRAAAEAAADATEGMHLALFGEGGFVSPREVTYRPQLDPGRLLSDLRGFYEAFHYAPRAEDPPDHIAVEAGFLGYLALKEVLAREAADEEAAAICAGAARRFWAEHLAQLAEPCHARLLDAGVEHLRLAAGALVTRGRHLDPGPEEAP